MKQEPHIAKFKQKSINLNQKLMKYLLYFALKDGSENTVVFSFSFSFALSRANVTHKETKPQLNLI